MAYYQTTYGSTPAKGLPGQIANEEKLNKVSRTVESAAGIAFGQPAFRGAGDHGVVAGSAYQAAGVGSAAAGNTGNGTITAAPAAAAPAKQGRYTLTAISATQFEVEDPDNVDVGVVTVGTAKTLAGVGPLTIAAGGTAFVAGDQFYVDVTYQADAIFVGLAVLTPAVPPVAAGTTLVDGYPQYYTGAFMTDGSMYVVAGGTVKAGDTVFWNPSTQRYQNSNANGAVKLGVSRLIFDTSGNNGDMVEVSLRHR